MTHPRARCNRLLSDFTVCRIQYSDHALSPHPFHPFTPRPRFKYHIMSPLNLVYCGRGDTALLFYVTPRRIFRRELMNNGVCLSCMKTLIWVQERQKILRF